MKTLNLGIVAHVDAGKTSLTERLLYDAGVIDEVGSVDDGSTQTDTLALERRRGITIKSAVVSFAVQDTTVNLIDTPGHSDFIAEVERVLCVLDGAVLVLSAVEGVQAQTRVLMRVLQRLRIPTLLFVNKIDRTGADEDRVLADIRARLSPQVVAMGSVSAIGTSRSRVEPFGGCDAGFTTRLLDLLAERDDALLAAYTQDGAVGYPRLRAALAQQSRRGWVHPVFFGCALTGAGLDTLRAALVELLPAAEADADGPVSGTVFKVARGAAGERVAYLRLFSGTVRVRDTVPVGGLGSAKVTSVNVFEDGTTRGRQGFAAGQIATVRGLGDVRVGDPVGRPPATPSGLHYFSPPTLETVVDPCRREQRAAAHAALGELAEQDPLINLRHDDVRHEVSVSLYGEVQKEVIAATLAEEYGVDVSFRETSTIHVEQVVGTGEAVEAISVRPNPFLATVGLRVEPGPEGSGARFALGVELGSMPLAFFTAVEETVRTTLEQGLWGWQVVDCVVTMTHSGYYPRQSHAHGVFDKSMSSTAGDFRLLTPLVLVAALRRAGTRVLQPMHRFEFELPAELLGATMSALAGIGAIPLQHEPRGATYLLLGEVPAAAVRRLQQELPTLTRGEGELRTWFDRWAPAEGTPPRRPRTDHNPLDRKEYLLHVQRRV